MKNLFLVTFAFIPIQAKFSWDLHPDDWNPPMVNYHGSSFQNYFSLKMEKRMLNTHPELFNSDYEVEFPFDDDQIVKRLDYEDIPVSKTEIFK